MTAPHRRNTDVGRRAMIKETSDILGVNGSGSGRPICRSDRDVSLQSAPGEPQPSGARRRARPRGPSLDMADMPTMLEPPPVVAPTISINDLDSLSEPVFDPDSWLDDSPTGTMADHPLLRGLLMELPAKGTVPQADWLDRWFDAARSILDLLYAQHANRVSHR